MGEPGETDHSRRRSTVRRAMLVLAAGAVGIGSAPIWVRLSETGPAATAFWRLALAWPFFLVLSARQRRGVGHAPPERRPRRALLWLSLPGIFFACDLAVWHWSIRFTTVANATLFANCTPIFVSVAAWMWLGERFRRSFVVGLVLAMVGVACLVGSSFELGRLNILGDALGLVTAVFYSGYILAVKRAREHFSTARIMSWSIPAGCILLLAISLASGERFAAGHARGWLVLVGLAACAQVGGQGLIARALAHLPASFASVSLLIQPVVATLLAAALFGEALGPLQGLGAVMLLAGLVLARRGSRFH
ncbi:MAG: DMT family transporter [Planctomycetota bacterium]